jgi:hypothetical protein
MLNAELAMALAAFAALLLTWVVLPIPSRRK